ncbi:hypothetical protein N2152v2_009231 [Parachlorella kessleri]
MAGAAQSDGEQTGMVAGQQDLEAFASHPGVGNGLSEPLRGVLAETALTGCIRYPWHLLKPLCQVLIDQVFSEFAAEEQLEGPPRPMPGGGSPDSVRSGLHSLLDSFSEAPFTLQRLCEVLLEPRKQYRRLDKLAAAVEKLLLVTSTCPPTPDPPSRPSLAALGPVNTNPPSPYLVTTTPTAAGGAAVAAGQLQLVPHLPNGQATAAAGADGGGGNARPPGSDTYSAVHRMFMQSSTPSPAESAGAQQGAGGAAGATQPAGVPGGAAVEDGLTAEDAEEAKRAEQFVKDALMDIEPPAEGPHAQQPQQLLQQGQRTTDAQASASVKSAASPAAGARHEAGGLSLLMVASGDQPQAVTEGEQAAQQGQQQQAAGQEQYQGGAGGGQEAAGLDMGDVPMTVTPAEELHDVVNASRAAPEPPQQEEHEAGQGSVAGEQATAEMDVDGPSRAEGLEAGGAGGVEATPAAEAAASNEQAAASADQDLSG